jgi:pimeloyl-ACP methyl ester carboxylesterase
MTTLSFGHVLSNGVRIHYYHTAEDKPPVILLHGFSDNGLCWGRTALRLSPDYDVTMIDARGHGLSAAPETGYTVDEHAGDVAAVIQALELKKVVLIGHSMGAATAARTAALYPQLIKKVVLEDPPWRNHQNGDETHKFHSFRDQIEQFRTMSLDDIIAMGKKDNPTWDESEWLQWAKSKQQVRAQAASAVLGLHTAWKETASQIACPVLLICADPEKGALVTPEIANEAKQILKKGSVIVQIPGAGHNIRREQFEKYFDVVSTFLER